VHNVGSIRVLEKCGFRPVEVDGEPHATVGADGIEEVLLVLDADA
jgi:RimJ/RimL family protein N-acetyltransferase